MTATSPSSKRRIILVAVGCAALLAAACVAWRLVVDFRERAIGNYPVVIRGRIVSVAGTPIAGVNVTMQLLSAGRGGHPGMFRRPEVVRRLVVQTDEHGDFELSGVRGYSVSIIGFSDHGGELDWAFSPRDPRNPPLTFNFDLPVRAGVPDARGRGERAVYVLGPPTPYIRTRAKQ